MTFEWDETKRASNIAKHGVDFVRAARVFEGPVLERSDDRSDYGEPRFIVLGRVEDMCLVVVYAWRDGTRRIISAWKAGRHEESIYHARFGR